jgi:hypothetical protein
VTIALPIAFIVLPLLVLRGATLMRCYASLITLALFAWIVARRLPSLDAHFGVIAFAVVALALFAIFLACGSNVRWSANRAALVAAIVYSLTIPMTAWKVDGDESYYLLITESLLHDGDLDLANQYATLEKTASGRLDLVPLPGDPKGAHGEQYSHLEPFFPLLLVPGYALGGLQGALAVIALFGVLLVRSTVRWMEDEGVADASVRAVFPFFAFAPPLLFYATRIWAEVPAAFLFVEALRGARAQRAKRWVPALLALVLLKLRFALVAIGLIVAAFRARRSRVLLALAILAVPLLALWLLTGSATNVHSWHELLPEPAMDYVRGLGGLLADGMGGIAFQAPFYLFGLVAIVRWRETPRGFRIGILSALLYLFYLLPREESFSSWGPPLRYLVFLMPVLALGAAAIWERIPRSAIAIVAAWTIGLVIHGIAYPWRLFHEATGENAVGEWLSMLYQSDFSRMFPSFVRINHAAWIAPAVVLLGTLASRRLSRWRPAAVPRADSPLHLAIFALALGFGFRWALNPASRVDFEDSHVVHAGGHLEPRTGTSERALYRGGWVLQEGDSLTFLARAGTHRLHAITGLGATIELGGHAYRIEPSLAHRVIRVTIAEDGPVTLRCVSGAVNLDQLERVE